MLVRTDERVPIARLLTVLEYGERPGGFPSQPILEDVVFCEQLIRIILHAQFRLPVLPRVFFQDAR